jgi:hypothetical protein
MEALKKQIPLIPLKGSARQVTILGAFLCVLRPKKSLACIAIKNGQPRRRVLAKLTRWSWRGGYTVRRRRRSAAFPRTALKSSQRIQHCLAVYAFVCRHLPHDSIERAPTRRGLWLGDRESLVAWRRSLKDYVTALLMRLTISPVAAKHFDQLRTA